MGGVEGSLLDRIQTCNPTATTQIPHLKKWKTSLEPAVKRAMMIWYKQKPITNEVHLLCSKELCLSSTPRRRTRPV